MAASVFENSVVIRAVWPGIIVDRAAVEHFPPAGTLRG